MRGRLFLISCELQDDPPRSCVNVLIILKILWSLACPYSAATARTLPSHGERGSRRFHSYIGPKRAKNSEVRCSMKTKFEITLVRKGKLHGLTSA